MSQSPVEYHGRCHCGAVRFSFVMPPIQSALRCNCSLCVRKGIAMSADVVAPDDFHIDAEPGVLGTYQFGRFIAKHYFCTRCGINVFHQTMRKVGHYRVNLGCIDDLDVYALPVEVFDGKHLI